MNWRTKHKITTLLWALIISCVPTGVSIALGKVWWEVYTAPLFGLTLEEILLRPLLDTIFGVLWFLVIPQLAVACIPLIIAGFVMFADEVL